MNTGIRLAIAVLLISGAMFCYFVAFHPGGITDSSNNPAKNPRDVLQWIMAEFNTQIKGGGANGVKGILGGPVVGNTDQFSAQNLEQSVSSNPPTGQQ